MPSRTGFSFIPSPNLRHIHQKLAKMNTIVMTCSEVSFVERKSSHVYIITRAHSQSLVKNLTNMAKKMDELHYNGNHALKGLTSDLGQIN